MLTYGASSNMPVEQAKLSLPDKSGVYLFRRKDGRVMYVGKATNLQTRVRSYFSSNPDRKMIPQLVSDADDVEYIVTQSPSEALILER